MDPGDQLGYTRYDREDFRLALRARGAAYRNASSIFRAVRSTSPRSSPAAETIDPAQCRDQLKDHSWHYEERRRDVQLLTGQTVLMLGFGAIGRRLAELLAVPQIYAVRRQAPQRTGRAHHFEEELTRVLPLADHVVNILSDNETTRGYINARRLGWFKPGAWEILTSARHDGR